MSSPEIQIVEEETQIERKPYVKPKRVCSQSQLDNLAKGRAVTKARKEEREKIASLEKQPKKKVVAPPTPPSSEEEEEEVRYVKVKPPPVVKKKKKIVYYESDEEEQPQPQQQPQPSFRLKRV
jgi:hypothetical protein